MATLLLVLVLIVLLVGVNPAWPHAAGYGYWPSGLIGLILVIFLVLFLIGIV